MKFGSRLYSEEKLLQKICWEVRARIVGKGSLKEVLRMWPCVIIGAFLSKFWFSYLVMLLDNFGFAELFCRLAGFRWSALGL